MTGGDRLQVRVLHDGERIVGVTPELHRSVAGVMSLLQGREPEQGLTLIERLFSICTHAHGVAGRRALNLARGKAPDTEAGEHHEARLAVERIRETALRLLTGWHFAEGDEAATRELLVLVSGLLAALSRGEAVRELQEQVGQLSGLWNGLCRDKSSLDDWIGHRAARWQGIRLGPGVPALSPEQSAEIARALATDEGGHFCSAPVLSGRCYMTGPSAGLSQQRDGAQYIAGVLSALFAQVNRDILYLQQGTGAMTAEDYSSGPGVGYGWALSARGWLLHRVVLAEEKIRKWQILAPTDWNFQGTGVLHQRLLGVEVPGHWLESLVNDLILSVDPCVSFEVSIGHA